MDLGDKLRNDKMVSNHFPITVLAIMLVNYACKRK